MKKNVAVLNYGVGNINSLKRAVEYCGSVPHLVTSKDDFTNYDKFILPGVGAFRHAMQNIIALNLDHKIKGLAEQGVPILGICLGMQLLYESSTENGNTKGLAILNGFVDRIDAQCGSEDELILPHVGWSKLTYKSTGSLGSLGESEEYAYFVHSYKVNAEDVGSVRATTNYCGIDIPAIISAENVFGCQFHPEKSGTFGLDLLNEFIEL